MSQGCRERAKYLLALFVVGAIPVFCLESVAAAQVTFGAPLPGLTVDQLALFQAGKVEFEEVEKVDDGLGPTFNGQACAECHTKPVVGGSSTQSNEVRAGQLVNGRFVNLPGGSLFQIKAIAPTAKCGEVVPAAANVIAFRQTQPLFGMGLIEAIPDQMILAGARRTNADSTISGRAAFVTELATGQRRLGRFGWKAQVATLLDFAGDAYLNEMGITNDLVPAENAPNGDQARLAACDTVPDPEDVRDPVTGRRGIDNFENFMRFLAPPPRGPITATVLQGEQTFTAIGCAQCHTPEMQSGPNAVAALSNKRVRLFSDLLLHDIGTGDGIPQGDAGPNEIRTQPLWGLRVSHPFLHDGSASTIEGAILRHAGEATAVSDRFRALSPTEKDQLLAFLDSL